VKLLIFQLNFLASVSYRVFFKTSAGKISSGNTNPIDVSSVAREVEGTAFDFNFKMRHPCLC
jgi:hypothetical protein